MNHKSGRRTRSRAAVMAADPNCIYCGRPADKQEHMPPIVMFEGRHRPGGMEYATCADCNNGTSAADSVAAFLAKISWNAHPSGWQIVENVKQRAILNEIAPGFMEELFEHSQATPLTVPTKGGVLVRQTFITADGPLIKSYLSVFAAKLAMALFREQTGKSLPQEGGVEAWHYLNAGLTQETAEKIVSIMPGSGTLAAGRKSVGDQFQYRFNTDGKTIVAALASFHKNLHIAFLASSTPEVYKMPCRFPHATYTQPGQLMAMMPKIERSRRIMLPGLGGDSYSIRVPARQKSE